MQKDDSHPTTETLHSKADFHKVACVLKQSGFKDEDIAERLGITTCEVGLMWKDHVSKVKKRDGPCPTCLKARALSKWGPPAPYCREGADQV